MNGNAAFFPSTMNQLRRMERPIKRIICPCDMLEGKMKRYLLWIMLLCLLPPGGAGAEVQRYAIRDLPAVTSPRWEQTYTAYGRTIQVSEEIQIPRVDSAPVLTVRAAPPVADTIAQELTAFCEKSMREDRVHSYSFASTAYVTA